jgi:hypothetical protein
MNILIHALLHFPVLLPQVISAQITLLAGKLLLFSIQAVCMLGLAACLLFLTKLLIKHMFTHHRSFILQVYCQVHQQASFPVLLLCLPTANVIMCSMLAVTFVFPLFSSFPFCRT